MVRCHHQAMFDLEGLGLLLISLNAAVMGGPPLDAAALQARLRALGEADPKAFEWLTKRQARHEASPVTEQLDEIIRLLQGYREAVARRAKP